MANFQISPETAQACADYAQSVIASKTYEYEGNPVSFSNGDSLYANATQMAKVFNKLPGDWLRLKSTEAYLYALSSDMQIPISQIVIVNKGNSAEYEQGTWLHEDAALEFARWLSPKFAIWCNRKIKELLTQGDTEVRPQPLTPAQQLLANAQMLVEMERKQMELDSRQTVTENKVALIEERVRDNGFMTVMGFANIQHLKIGTKALQKLGKQCAAWCRRMGIVPEQTRHDKFGHVNTYPMQALRDVFKAAYPDKAALIDTPTYWG